MQSFFSVPFPLVNDPPHQAEGKITPEIVHQEDITSLGCPKPFMRQEKSITKINHTTRIKIAAEFVDSSNRINKCSSADDVCSDAYVCTCMRNTCSNEILTRMQIRSSTFPSTHSIKIAAESINSTHQIKTFCCKYLPPHMKVSSSTPPNSFIDQVNDHSSKMKIAAEFVDSSHQIKTFNSKYLPPHMKVCS